MRPQPSTLYPYRRTAARALIQINQTRNPLKPARIHFAVRAQTVLITRHDRSDPVINASYGCTSVGLSGLVCSVAAEGVCFSPVDAVAWLIHLLPARQTAPVGYSRHLRSDVGRDLANAWQS